MSGKKRNSPATTTGHHMPALDNTHIKMSRSQSQRRPSCTHDTSRRRSADAKSSSGSINTCLSLYFGDKKMDSDWFPLTLMNEIVFRNIRDGETRLKNVGTKLNICANEDACEILKKSFSKDNPNETTKSIIDCDFINNNSDKLMIPVWKFPRRIDPVASKNSSINEKLCDVLTATVDYWYLPDFINTVFVIGENGSGKSLLLSRFVHERKEDVLLITSAQAIQKFDTDGAYYSTQHKAKQPSPEDNELIGKLTPKAEEQINERFESITKLWKLQFTNSTERGRKVYFQRKTDENNSTIVGVYQYESVSDGIRQIFHVVLRYPHLERYRIVCLDEPEAHLHPRLYCALVQDIIKQLREKLEADVKSPRQAVKLIIATHDFHLIDLLAKMQEIHGVVMETSLRPVRNAPVDAKHFEKKKHSPGPINQMHATLYSIINTTCTSPFVFDRNQSRRSLISFSSALLQCMTDTAPIVLFCEGHNGNQSIDHHFYRLLFDPNKIEIRSVEGGCEDVRLKTKAARQAQQLLCSPRIYIGLCDRDRNFGILQTGTVVLPVAEIENLFWLPQLWDLYGKMLQVFDSTVADSYIKVKKEEFWKRFRSLVKSRLYYYMCEYALAHHNNIHHQKSRKDANRRPLKDCPKENIQAIETIMNRIQSEINSERELFDSHWWPVIKDAHKYSFSWLERKEMTTEEHLNKYKSTSPTDNLDDNNTVFKCNEILKLLNDSQPPNVGSFPRKLFRAFVQMSNAGDAEDEAFQEYYHLLNEKEVCQLLQQTLFGSKKLHHFQKDPLFIMNIFTKLLNKNINDGLNSAAKALREEVCGEMLAIFKQIFSNAFYPDEDTKQHIQNSLRVE